MSVPLDGPPIAGVDEAPPNPFSLEMDTELVDALMNDLRDAFEGGAGERELYLLIQAHFERKQERHNRRTRFTNQGLTNQPTQPPPTGGNSNGN